MPQAMTRPLRSKAALFTIAALVVGQPISAFAEEGAEAPASNDVKLAEQRAAQAFEAYQKREYPTAVALYLEAYNAASSADMLYNIARIYDTKLGDRQLAMTFYRRYIADPGAASERIKRANDRLVELREAEIAAADRGSREPRSPSKEPRTSPAPEPSDRSSSLSQTGAIVGLGGLIGVGVGAGFGISAMAKAHTARDLCNGNACTTQQGVDAARDASRNATISTIGFAAGGTLLAFGAFLFFSGRKQAEREPAASIRWGAAATSSRLSVEMSGTW
jgi:hypothetical protein